MALNSCFKQPSLIFLISPLIEESTMAECGDRIQGTWDLEIRKGVVFDKELQSCLETSFWPTRGQN